MEKGHVLGGIPPSPHSSWAPAPTFLPPAPPNPWAWHGHPKELSLQNPSCLRDWAYLWEGPERPSLLSKTTCSVGLSVGSRNPSQKELGMSLTVDTSALSLLRSFWFC